MQFIKQNGQHLRTFQYTTIQEFWVAHVIGKEQPDEKSREQDVKQVDERVRKDRAVLLDVVLVRLEKKEGQDQVE